MTNNQLSRVSIASAATMATHAATIPAIGTIVTNLLDIMRKQTGRAGGDWSAQTTMEETGIDSFDFVELVFDVEERYAVDLNFYAKGNDGLATVADVAGLIHARLLAQSSAS